MKTPFLEMRLRVPLDRFDLDVDCATDERVLGLFGPSGSGKTTWLESIAGLRRTVSGKLSCGETVWLDSERGINLPPEQRGIGYVPQDQRLFPHFDVRDNLRFAARLRTSAGEQREATFREVVEVLELEPLLARSTRELSGGERQRVALGRALCSGPRLLLLDEPLASLDSQLRHRILPFLKRVKDHFDLPMLIVSHQPLELQALCDEVIALRRGRAVAQGRPTEIFTREAADASAMGEGFENIFTATLAATGDASSRLQLTDAGGPELLALPVNGPPGASVIVGIPAHDILIAESRIEGTSARNCLAGKITELRRVGPRVLVFTEIAGSSPNTMVVEVTVDAVEQMSLQAGQSVWLLFKSSSIRVYGGRDRANAASSQVTDGGGSPKR
jgi:molybdate transport system ATP-binding protein